MKREVKAPDTEPEEVMFELPSEGEHLFQVVNTMPTKDNDPDIIIVKLEIALGAEEGRTILQRINLDDSTKSFYFTRLFLKAIGQDYKGSFTIDDDNFIGKQFYATVVHNGKYANIQEYNFDKIPERPVTTSAQNNDQKVAEGETTGEDVQWDEHLT